MAYKIGILDRRRHTLVYTKVKTMLQYNVKPNTGTWGYYVNFKKHYLIPQL